MICSVQEDIWGCLAGRILGAGVGRPDFPSNKPLVTTKRKGWKRDSHAWAEAEFLVFTLILFFCTPDAAEDFGLFRKRAFETESLSMASLRLSRAVIYHNSSSVMPNKNRPTLCSLNGSCAVFAREVCPTWILRSFVPLLKRHLRLFVTKYSHSLSDKYWEQTKCSYFSSLPFSIRITIPPFPRLWTGPAQDRK